MKIFASTGGFCLLAFILAVGCGGGSDSKSGGTFTSSVPSGSVLGTLSSSQDATLCNEIEAYANSAAVKDNVVELDCRTTGYLAALLGGATTDAAAQAACKTAYDACKKSPPASTTGTCTPPDATCTATVAELEACVNTIPQEFSDALAQFPSCDKVTLQTLQNLSTNQTTLQASAACTTYDTKCPNGPTSTMMN